MELDDLRVWHIRLRSELDEARFDVGWQGPVADRPKQSACLSIDGPDRLGELIVWSTGEAQLQLGDVASGEVLDEQLQLIDARQLAQAVTRMKAWVTGS
ncbi:hypothetical protein OG873_25215 [Streptomyces violaceus]|uniref:hypothetical protein n=1 Tax=Streptomyces violaceus TaxID=1936 RepID=UPI002E27F3A8|nr:hypothetical protein [Streptomyces violaceus]